MVTLLAALGKAELVALFEKYEGVVKAADWVNKSPLDAAIRDAGARVEREMTQVCYAVVRALIAAQLGHHPNDHQVQAFLLHAIDDPSFPSRAYRLFGEAKKSSSERRRHLLASVLFGLPFTRIPSDEVDRIDITLERMIPADAYLLLRLSEMAKAPLLADSVVVTGMYMNEVRPTTCEVIVVRHEQSSTDLRIITSNDYPKDSQFEDDFFEKESFVQDPIALDTLDSLGCVSVREAQSHVGRRSLHRLLVTPLGDLVVQVLLGVRAGYEAAPSPGR